MKDKKQYFFVGLIILIGATDIGAMLLRIRRLPSRLPQLSRKQAFSEKPQNISHESLINRELSLNLGFLTVARTFLSFIEHKNSLGLFGWRSKIKTPENIKREKMLAISSSIRNTITKLEDKIKNFKKTNLSELQ